MTVPDQRSFNALVLLLHMIQTHNVMIDDPKKSDHITCCTNSNTTDLVVMQCTY